MGPMVYGAAWWRVSERPAIQKEFKFMGKMSLHSKTRRK